MEITLNILHGVGKKMRCAYSNGQVSDGAILRCYEHNRKEAEAFNPMGLSIFDLNFEMEHTHNPILAERLKTLISAHKDNTTKSRNQNQISLLKLSYYRKSALGIGLHGVIRELRKMAGKGDNEAKIVLCLLEIEFANLSAKLHHDKRTIIYERKSILLDYVSDLLYDNGWRCGISSNTGKNANYIVYVYLPNGIQLSWHCNDFNLTYCYDEIDCEFDGRVCSTLEKLLEYVHGKFNIGASLVEYEMAA